jgi:polyhydroxyalkanoate synthesis regulator phasin
VAQFDSVGFAFITINQSNFKKIIMNDLFKKAIQAGLGLAVVTTERVKEIVEDFVEKGKTYQDKQEKEEKEEETVKGEAAQDKEENEPKQSRFEEIENRVRKLIENAISRFNFIKSDEHERIEKRIEALEEKLNQLVKETIGQKTESSERI